MIGQTISHYRLTDRISEGAMGTIYKAEDLDAPRTVAVKVVKPTRQDPETATQRFMLEADTIAQINHPNVIGLYDVVAKGDLNFLVMEFIDGASLRTLLSRERMQTGEVLRIACEIAAGLGAAHKLGVIHRDVKPENVMVTHSGLCKVCDFGVARLVDQSSWSGRRRIIGTLPYMAPEQIQGQKSIDMRVDVYGLGVVLFEMFSGKLPFESTEEPALFYQVLNVEAAMLGTLADDLPEGVEAIVSKALQKNRADRYPSAVEMFFELEDVRSRLGFGETPEEHKQTPPPDWRSRFKRFLRVGLKS